MRHVFIGLSGGMGPIMRTAPIANYFQQAEVQVSFSAYGEYSLNILKQLGYGILPDEGTVAPSRAYALRPQSQFYHLDHYFAQMGLLDKAFTAAWIRDRIALLEKEKVDFVIADLSPHTLIAAKVLGIPAISITQSCLHPDGKALYHWGSIPRNISMVTPVINEILSDYQLPSIDKIEDLNKADVNIMPSIPELDPVQHDDVVYVGPISMNMHENTSHAVAEDKPNILIYPGRMEDSTGLTGLNIIESVIHAFAKKAVNVILATSETLPSHMQQSIPDNVTLVPYFNDDQLQHFQLYIHHGGHGSCLAAIQHGVPSLIIPTHTEREFNARQVYEMGIGEYVLPGTFTPDHLYQLCMYMMEDQYKQRAMEWKKCLEERHYGGAQSVFFRAIQLEKNNKKKANP
ncbi:glycosyltransferase [Longirhabdus pacifica]|uniref:glycosyltransferase n=1 Tax=Longirhabdus pacifica TaxID=2305227 RepID=UPI0013E8B60D|nr:glycosyltransferase family 1 protein [Longirhabdus pacifica]